MQRRLKLRELLQGNHIIVAPGCHDALGAKIIEHTGFEAIYMTGNGTAASLLGKPDIGLVTMSEMVTHARGIISAVEVPVICDADTGYGDINNIIRTVQEYEAVGASAIHLEDQSMPKKCGAMPGLEFVSIEEHVNKIKAAVQARKDKNFLIIARTDSRGTLGLKEAIRRGQAYARAGADIVYVELLETVEEMREVVRNVEAPVMYDLLEHFRMPFLSIKELENIGYKLVIFPLSVTLTYAKSIHNLLLDLKSSGTTRSFWDKMLTLQEYETLLGNDQIRQRQERIIASE